MRGHPNQLAHAEFLKRQGAFEGGSPFSDPGQSSTSDIQQLASKVDQLTILVQTLVQAMQGAMSGGTRVSGGGGGGSVEHDTGFAKDAPFAGLSGGKLKEHPFAVFKRPSERAAEQRYQQGPEAPAGDGQEAPAGGVAPATKPAEAARATDGEATDTPDLPNGFNTAETVAPGTEGEDKRDKYFREKEEKRAAFERGKRLKRADGLKQLSEEASKAIDAIPGLSDEEREQARQTATERIKGGRNTNAEVIEEAERFSAQQEKAMKAQAAEGGGESGGANVEELKRWMLTEFIDTLRERLTVE